MRYMSMFWCWVLYSKWFICFSPIIILRNVYISSVFILILVTHTSTVHQISVYWVAHFSYLRKKRVTPIPYLNSSTSNQFIAKYNKGNLESPKSHSIKHEIILSKPNRYHVLIDTWQKVCHGNNLIFRNYDTYRKVA